MIEKVIPPKWWPLLCAIVIAGGNLLWDATRYNNPIAVADVERAVGIGAIVFYAVRKGVKMSCED